VIPASGSVPGGQVRKLYGHSPPRALPPWAQLRTAVAHSVLLSVACLVSYLLTTRVLSLAYSVSTGDDALGGMWAVVATVFLYRDRQPILRLADTAIGVTVGLAAASLGLYAIRPRIRSLESR
jgi:hypothetical protein